MRVELRKLSHSYLRSPWWDCCKTARSTAETQAASYYHPYEYESTFWTVIPFLPAVQYTEVFI
eukprot:9951-Heterococcus_DN1.PRE.3